MDLKKRVNSASGDSIFKQLIWIYKIKYLLQTNTEKAYLKRNAYVLDSIDYAFVDMPKYKIKETNL